jgi:hypothetical protein
MGHYAFIDAENIVTEVITGRDENEIVDGITDWEAHYGSLRGQVCLRTSYNTRNGVHINNGTPFRKNFAGLGNIWDGVGFHTPQPYPSWTLDPETYLWNPPTPYPSDNKRYSWNEETLSWDGDGA